MAVTSSESAGERPNAARPGECGIVARASAGTPPDSRGRSPLRGAEDMPFHTLASPERTDRVLFACSAATFVSGPAH